MEGTQSETLYLCSHSPSFVQVDNWTAAVQTDKHTYNFNTGVGRCEPAETTTWGRKAQTRDLSLNMGTILSTYKKALFLIH